MVAQKLGISILRYLYWQHSKGTFSKYLWNCWEYNLVLNLVMIATDVMHCNHHHHISVIWVHFEKLVDEISSRTHWSGTAPLPLPLLCHPPFLQVNGTAAQQHLILLSSPWPPSPGSPRAWSQPSWPSSPWSPSPDQPHQGGDERPAAAWVHQPGCLLQQEPLLSCQVSPLAKNRFLKAMTFFIGPRSDHSLPMSVTDWLTNWLTTLLKLDVTT